MKTRNLIAASVVALSALVSTAANASVIYYFSNLGQYNGPAVATTSYFATAKFEDNGANTVKLTMTVAPTLDAGKYVNDWAFNSSVLITGATLFGAANPPTNVAASSKEYGDNVVNNFGGAPGGDFDLGFHFSTANPGQLQSGSSTYTITGAGLTENSFRLANEQGLFNAVHVQGNGASSYFFGTLEEGGGPGNGNIPEPSTVALLGLGLLSFAANRRRAAKNKKA
ncbi:PEP-CTERM sorting domain-containing protein [Noviherbaspirillum soli]|uniref:PEP-CTERM sorting domain-containing protein n=1 Tax=Noviherbaspirillum soli TaxID=1064518 RepID=UPI00188AE4A9|nr:PEP-CTERM sorting domain-containing protein [Noviherbaspirillum soli]